MARELLISRQVEEMLGAFERAGIPSILLKGTAFWGWLYELGERSVSDIDVLVPESLLRSGAEVLLSLGYTRVINPGRPVSNDLYYNWAFSGSSRERHPVAVELHQHLIHRGRYDIDGDGLFLRAEGYTFGKAPAQRLSVEDCLLQLAIHRSVHACGFTSDRRNLDDACRLLERRTPDWRVVVERARAWKCSIPVWLFLDSLVEGRVPSAVLAELAPDGIRGALLRLALVKHDGIWMNRLTWLPPLVRSRAVLFPLLVEDPALLLGFAHRYLRQRLADLTQLPQGG
jgi:hypothetical protein